MVKHGSFPYSRLSPESDLRCCRSIYDVSHNFYQTAFDTNALRPTLADMLKTGLKVGSLHTEQFKPRCWLFKNT